MEVPIFLPDIRPIRLACMMYKFTVQQLIYSYDAGLVNYRNLVRISGN